MKKIIKLISVLTLSVLLLSAVGCKKEEPLVVKESDTYIVITVSNDQMEIGIDTTLLDYMLSLKSDGQLQFKTTDGMITSVNGISNPADWSSCWMIYTSDNENANVGWGKMDYNGNIYGSAILGAEYLPIKDGCLYIWVFQSFS